MIIRTIANINNIILFDFFFTKELEKYFEDIFTSEEPHIEQISLPPSALSAMRFLDPHVWQDLVSITNYKKSFRNSIGFTNGITYC